MSHLFSTSSSSASCTSSREHCLCRGSHHWRMPSAVSIASECSSRYASMFRMSRSRSGSGEIFFKEVSVPKRLRQKTKEELFLPIRNCGCSIEKSMSWSREEISGAAHSPQRKRIDNDGVCLGYSDSSTRPGCGMKTLQVRQEARTHAHAYSYVI